MKALHHVLPSGRIVVDDAVLKGKIIAAIEYAHKKGEPISIVRSPDRDKQLRHRFRLQQYALANGVVSTQLKEIIAEDDSPITTQIELVSNQRVWIGGTERLVPETTYLSSALA